jgi:hypothetical protein
MIITGVEFLRSFGKERRLANCYGNNQHTLHKRWQDLKNICTDTLGVITFLPSKNIKCKMLNLKCKS